MALSPYDQQVYDAGFKYVPQSQYLLNPFQIPQGEESEGDVAPGLPAIYQAQGGGGGGSYSGGVNDLIKNFDIDRRNRYFDKQPTPLVDGLYQSKLDKTFLGMPSYQQQQLTGPDLGEYIGTDTDVPLELTRAGKIQSGLGSFRDNVGKFMGRVAGFGPVSAVLNSMDRFNTLSPADQQFIEMNMGYTGPTVFGENASGLSKDPYGINTRSAFGNYADYVEDKVAEYDDKYGDLTEEEFNELSNFQKTKVNFYRQKQKELKQIEERKEQERQQRVEEEREKARRDNQGTQRRSDGSGGGNLSRSREQGGLGLSASQAQEVSAANAAAGMGGWGLADGGRVPYMYGGLADLVDIYD